MKKKYISLFLALVMIVSLAVPTTLATESSLYDELMATGHVVDFEGVYTSATAEAKNAMTTQQITGVYNFLNSLYIDASASALLAKRDKLNTQILALPNAPELCTECGTLGGHTGGCSLTPTPEPTQEPTPTPEAGEPTPTPEVEVTPEPTEEPTPSAFEQIMAGATTTDMLITMNGLIETDLDAVFALTFEEIDAIAQQAKALDSALSSQDTVDLLDTLTYLPNSMASVGCPDCGQTVEHAEDCPRALAAMMPADGLTINGNRTINGTVITGNNTVWNFKKDATVTLNGSIYIPNGKTLTIKGNGNSAVIIAGKTIVKGENDSQSNGVMFRVQDGGTLILNGVTIDGGAVWSGAKDATVNRGIVNGGYRNRLVQVDPQTVDDNPKNSDKSGYEFVATNCTFQNSHHTSSLYFGYLADAYFEGGSVVNCELNDGAGIIYIPAYSSGGQTGDTAFRTFTMIGTKLYGNRETGGSGGVIRTNGSTKISMTLTNIQMYDNYSSGWGNILWNAIGTCTITGSTFTHNTSGRRGGAISSEGQGLTVSGCSFVNNSAGEMGGAIAVFPYSLAGKDELSGSELVMSVGIGEGCVFENNTAPLGGAVAFGIQPTKSVLPTTVNAEINLGTNGYMKNNTATNSGGAVYAGSLAITQNDIDGGRTINPASKINLIINNGEISGNTAAKTGGAIYVNDLRTEHTGINSVIVNGGTIGAIEAANTAPKGGAIAIDDGTFTMNGGTVAYNSANESGGAVYINGGSATVSGGTIQKNSATTNGGGLYVSGSGGMTVSGGTITENTATNGGGAYVTGGSIQMTGGTITANTATTNGGGVAVDGGGFTMISGTMTGNKATGSASLGGGAYTKGGSVIIGVQNCSGAGEKHSVTHTNLTHPTVSDNEAGFGGGGLAAQGGDVTLYCGTVSDNTALSKGTGHNVFMNSGSQGELTHYLDSTNVGQETDHDIVQIGGKLNVVSNELGGDTTSVNYYSNYKTTEKPSGDVWPAETPNGYWVNLPYCPPEWEAYQNTKGLTFVGWTTTPSDPIGDCSGVRDKGDYKFIGDPVEIKDGLKFYAVWAPMTNNLTFDSAMLNYSTTGDYIVTPVPTDLSCYVDGAELTGISTSNTYNYNVLSAPGDLVLNKPNVPGYDFLGWVLKADTGAISNWNSDNTTSHPSSVYLLSATGAQTDRAGNSWSYDANGTLTIDMNYNFGHLTFVALLKEQAVTLTYVAVGPDGKPYGELNPHASDDVFGYTETFGAATGTATPVTAMPAYGYKFEGWHTDEDCTVDVGLALVSGEKGVTITPKKNADGIYESGTFYALFDFHLADLYLTKTATGTTDSEQRYLFKVYEVVPGTGTTTTDKYLTTVVIPNGGTVVINDLFIGTTYKVVEDTAWSWRHDPETEGGDSQTIEIVPNAEKKDINKRDFTNEQNRDYWLTSDDYQLNSFGMAVN